MQLKLLLIVRNMVDNNLNDLIAERLIEKIKRVGFKDDEGPDKNLEELCSMIHDSTKNLALKKLPVPVPNDELCKSLSNCLDNATERSLLSGIDVEEIEGVVSDFKVVLEQKKREFDVKTMVDVLKALMENARKNSSIPDLSISKDEIQKLKNSLPKVVNKMIRSSKAKRNEDPGIDGLIKQMESKLKCRVPESQDSPVVEKPEKRPFEKIERFLERHRLNVIEQMQTGSQSGGDSPFIKSCCMPNVWERIGRLKGALNDFDCESFERIWDGKQVEGDVGKIENLRLEMEKLIELIHQAMKKGVDYKRFN